MVILKTSRTLFLFHNKLVLSLTWHGRGSKVPLIFTGIFSFIHWHGILIHSLHFSLVMSKTFPCMTGRLSWDSHEATEDMKMVEDTRQYHKHHCSIDLASAPLWPWYENSWKYGCSASSVIEFRVPIGCSGGVSSTVSPVNSWSKYRVSVSDVTCGLNGGDTYPVQHLVRIQGTQ